MVVCHKSGKSVVRSCVSHGDMPCMTDGTIAADASPAAAAREASTMRTANVRCDGGEAAVHASAGAPQRASDASWIAEAVVVSSENMISGTMLCMAGR